jgi:transposase
MIKTKYDRGQRFKWYLQTDKYRRTVKETCKIFGISRKCYYKWKNRDYEKGGDTYLPIKNQPNLKLTYEVRKFIEKEKLRTDYGPLKMKIWVKRKLDINISTTIIYRYYKRKGLIRKPQKKLSWYQPMKKALIIKKEGQGAQMDVKYVYESRKRMFQFLVFDPYTCKYHFSVFSSKESRNAIIAFQKAEKYFGFKIESV